MHDLPGTISTGVNGQNLSITYSSTGDTATAAVGTYPITGTLGNGTGVTSNYTVNLVNGTLTVLLTSSAGASIYLLSTSSSAALSLSGNAQLKVGGVLDVDSNSSSAISASGNPILSATGGIQVVGKVQSSGNAHLSPSPVTGIASFGDPLATLPVPSTSTGVVNTLMGSLSVSGNSTQMIFPGIYSQMQFSGSAVVTFKPGIYVITGGGLSVSGNATLNGSGVMIYNTGSTYTATSGDGSGGTFGAVSFSGNAQMNLTPSTSGTYANILFFQSRSNAKPFTLSGNADPSTPCVIYALTAPVALSGNSVVGGQFQTTLVASTLNLSGNAIFQLANDGTGGFSPRRSALPTASATSPTMARARPSPSSMPTTTQPSCSPSIPSIPSSGSRTPAPASSINTARRRPS